MKIKCKQFECEVCKRIASIQIFYNNAGAVKYARARHYSGLINGKPKFEYHKQSIEYLGKTLGQDQLASNIDLERTELSSRIKLEPSAGFGPATITLPR
jgi:hypothetical protein